MRSANAAFSGVGGVGLPWRVRRAKELGGGHEMGILGRSLQSRICPVGKEFLQE